MYGMEITDPSGITPMFSGKVKSQLYCLKDNRLSEDFLVQIIFKSKVSIWP